MSFTYLTYEEAIALHELSLQRYGGSPGLRDSGLLQSALSQPQQLVFGTERFPSLEEKAAAYLFFIAKNHAFVDGNKRTALLACEVFLRMNEYSLNLSELEEEELVISVANGVLSLEDGAIKVRTALRPLAR